MRNYTEQVAATETVDGVEMTLYACDTGLWMGKRDTYYRAEFDGEAYAIGQAGENGYDAAIARAREVAALIATDRVPA